VKIEIVPVTGHQITDVSVANANTDEIIEASLSYSETTETGFIYSFYMPKHDVKIKIAVSSESEVY
jgi:hypothetical protein